MKQFLEKYLKRDIEVNEYNGERLPLMFSGLYQLYVLKADSFEWIVAVPKQQIGLRDLRIHVAQLEKYTDMNCAFCFDNVSYYIADALLDSGIAFIIMDKQIYLPFAGIMTQTTRNASATPVQEISFLTQKILLSAIYEKWKNMTITKIADAMEVTKAAVSKCFNEMEYLNVPVIELIGRSRVITVGDDVKSLWEQIKPILRNPVIKRFELDRDCKLDYMAGISALSEYTLLNDNNYPTYGVLKKNIRNLDMKLADARRNDIGCVVLELGYIIDYKGKHIMDPLSIVLSLSDQEKADERVRMSIDEMLEEYVW